MNDEQQKAEVKIPWSLEKSLFCQDHFRRSFANKRMIERQQAMENMALVTKEHPFAGKIVSYERRVNMITRFSSIRLEETPSFGAR